MGKFDGWRDYQPPTTDHRLKQAEKPKRSKYGASPHSVLPTLEVVEGAAAGSALWFSSKREAERYVELRNDREVAELTLQPRYPMHVVNPEGVKVCIGEYRADFRYQRWQGRVGAEVVEDAKGMRTKEYLAKKRHVEIEYGIRIQEV
jgi:hypothetical protein